MSKMSECANSRPWFPDILKIQIRTWLKKPWSTKLLIPVPVTSHLKSIPAHAEVFRLENFCTRPSGSQAKQETLINCWALIKILLIGINSWSFNLSLPPPLDGCNHFSCAQTELQCAKKNSWQREGQMNNHICVIYIVADPDDFFPDPTPDPQ